ncbi:glycosyltransferase family 8 protein [Lacrimispora sp. 38-1]|uniref:glycosyltransferase family 8 protein n=1 Tax=Lacrimispora sp. 38-1 TaxID=3125778 RepID=UPI003CF3DF74
MNILISICESFLIPAKVMLYSLCRFHHDVDVYLLFGSLKKEEIRDLELFLVNKCNARLHPVCALGFFTNVPLSSRYNKPELYYRLLAPYLLPAELDRVLYLDADIIINESLEEFYNQSFEGSYAAVVKDRFDDIDKVVLLKTKLGLKKEDAYFNSGVMLFNLGLFRKMIKLEDIMALIEEKREVLLYFDQDILNCLLKEHKKLCGTEYNTQTYPFDQYSLSDIKTSAAVIHFTGVPKPWDPDYDGTLDYLYWKNALNAGFVDDYLDYWEKKCGQIT